MAQRFCCPTWDNSWHHVTDKAISPNISVPPDALYLRRCIANNYTRIKDVERELSGLQMQLKLSTGPKKSALMMMRKKIELQNDRVLHARDRQRAAKKVHTLPMLCACWGHGHAVVPPSLTAVRGM